jgi:hypothetical protein
MTAVVPYNKIGPDTYVVSALIDGGVLVEPDGAAPGKVKAATAGTTKCLGVTQYSAAPSGAIQGNTSYGEVVIDMSTLQEEVAVAWQGTFSLKATGAVAFGDLVVCAAVGTVATAAAVTTPTPADVTTSRAIVGRCVEPLGIASGARGLIRLNLG